MSANECQACSMPAGLAGPARRALQRSRGSFGIGAPVGPHPPLERVDQLDLLVDSSRQQFCHLPPVQVKFGTAAQRLGKSVPYFQPGQPAQHPSRQFHHGQDPGKPVRAHDTMPDQLLAAYGHWAPG